MAPSQRHADIGGNNGTESFDWWDGIRIEAVARAYRWNKIPNRGGRTLVNGTGYDISLKSGETWYINNPLYYVTAVDTQIQFESNGETFSRFVVNIVVFGYLRYGNKQVHSTSGGWTAEAYKTVTFFEEPTGDLLTWLEACAVRQ